MLSVQNTSHPILYVINEHVLSPSGVLMGHGSGKGRKDQELCWVTSIQWKGTHKYDSATLSNPSLPVVLLVMTISDSYVWPSVDSGSRNRVLNGSFELQARTFKTQIYPKTLTKGLIILTTIVLVAPTPSAALLNSYCVLLWPMFL